jgi:hypothetical protein
MWRQVTTKNIKDLQSFSLTAAVMLGAALTFQPPNILNGGVSTVRSWGVLLFICALIGVAGEIWYNYGESPRRWLIVFGAHCGLTAIYSAFAVYSVLSIGPQHSGALMLAVLFANTAWLHRAFVHWKSDVDVPK